ncbi:hypothetical protein F7734_44240 [Scytonema sp. UIC 10036]|uniref:hypothetical protein n=1 Tax=Scytonema sp. UIC 10036 TaxID=2304196 RepID=UPI0012DA8C98|nr:hypothetical protein [Scytonema sp. UIC 10036]MUG98936.1 hypothetical protein [Scytonema sp. UIC 10036]
MLTKPKSQKVPVVSWDAIALSELSIDTTCQIVSTLYFSLSGVDCLLYKGLRYVFCAISGRMYYTFNSGVDLAAETFTG